MQKLGESVVRSLGLFISFFAATLVSCATVTLAPAPALDFFVPAGSGDPWNAKISNWQVRHDADPATREEPDAEASELGRGWGAFERDLRRQVARDTVAWVQRSARSHYRPDGATDHWATLGEVIESGQDDCDGLDLLTFVLLRRMGFRQDEIYRAIVVEDGTGQHHMVTLWFEDGRREDPYVLDPTGVVTPKMARLSSVPTWQPIELFDEVAHFSVKPSSRTSLVAAE